VRDSHANLSLLVVVVVGAVVVSWLLRKQWKANPLQGEDWCFVLYLFAAVALVISFLPPPDFVAAGRSGNLSPARLALILGVAASVLGGLLHVWLARRGALITWELRRRYVAGVALMAVIAVAFALAERAGVGQFGVLLGFLTLIFLLVALWVLLQVLRFLFGPGQRIARYLRDGKAEEAVRVGEAVPLDRRDAQTEWNLAVAYEAVGRIEDAEALWARLEERTDLPEQMATALQQRAEQMEQPASPSPGGTMAGHGSTSR
jgi:hypothetical protein